MTMKNNVGIKMDLKKNRIGRHGLDSSGSGQDQVVGSCEHCNELFTSIKCR
jgi:hypothetical protein